MYRLRDYEFVILYSDVCFLHPLISWSAATFGDRPPDIIERTLPLAGLTMQTIGWVGRFYFIVDGLIYPRRTECNTGAVEHRCASGLANVRIQNRQM